MAFGYQPAAADGLPPGFRPNIRTVDTGVEVIDLAAMRAELEATRNRQIGGGG